MDGTTRLQFISRRLYRRLNIIVGTERQIQIRRIVANLRNDTFALHCTLLDKQTYPQRSGSIVEGLRLRFSDLDYMIIYRHIKVIANSSILHSNGNDHKDTVLLMENDLTRPGFALLRLVSKPHHDEVTKSCVQYQQGLYLSSTLWKEVIPKRYPNSKLHGPCENVVDAGIEMDLAHCLKCNSWPALANRCIARLLRVKWPSVEIVRSILIEGCHLVAIGGKGSPSENIEWRVSFSFAEKIIIHDMNHCQFLCYGLLKIFLKEAIRKGDKDDLLCSYFLKTALFWEILENPTTVWIPSNLFNCFWLCFKRIISWVLNGYCPNFFIPENNMFYGKIHGNARMTLLDHLISLYNEGLQCLRKCPSLQNLLNVTVQEPWCNSEDVTCTKACYDTELFVEIHNELFLAEDTLAFRSTLSLMNNNNDDEISRLALYVWKAHVTQYLLVYPNSSYADNPITTNKRNWVNRRRILRAISIFACDALHHRLLQAVYMYRHGHFREVVKILLRSKRKLQNSHVMYRWNIDEEKYSAAGGNYTPFLKMIRRVMIIELNLPGSLCIPELAMEHQTLGLFKLTVMFPPLAIVNFLLFLCYQHFRQHVEAEAVLNDFAVLVRHDDGHHIHRGCKAISWTMLGICYEMSGNLAKAYKSYCAALTEKFNPFEDSTIQRICQLLKKIDDSS